MKKGYILIDVLMSIVLVVIIGLSLLPAVNSSLKANDRFHRDELLLNNMQNAMESAINNVYRGTEIREYKDITIETEYLGNLERIRVRGKSESGERVLEVIVKKEGIFSN